MTSTNQLILCLIAVFQLICFIYNVLMLRALYKSRKSSTLPLSYATVMCMSGILVTVFMTLNMMFYMVLNEDEYQVYLVHFGAEATVGSTFSYLNSIMVTVLMTVHRFSVVIRPVNYWFTHPKIFFYSAIIAVLVLVSLLIPYFSSCSITFMLNRLSFVSACAPNRHPITAFQNTYAIILPLSCMAINVGIITHLRLRKDGYKEIKQTLINVISCCIGRMYRSSSDALANSNKVGTTTPAPVVNTPSTPSNVNSAANKRKDISMMRQTLSIAVFLSIYELGAFITRLFPNAYASLPQEARDAYFYFRMESIAMMTFFIYYVNTPATRRMLNSSLGIKPKQSNAITVLTIAQRNVQQTQTIRMT